MAAKRKLKGQAGVGHLEKERPAGGGPEPVETYHQGKFPKAKKRHGRHGCRGIGPSGYTGSQENASQGLPGGALETID